MADLKKALMRQGYSEQEAEQEIQRGKQILRERLEAGQQPFDLCQELWRLEPDYLEDLMY